MNAASPPEISSVSQCECSWTTNSKMYRLYISRLLFIDTVEEVTLRLARVRKQWGSHRPIGIRVVNESVHVGRTSLKPISANPGWIGVGWDDNDTRHMHVEEIRNGIASTSGDSANCSDAACFNISSSQGLMLVLEVVGGEEGHVTYGVGMLNSTAILRKNQHYTKYPVYLFPTQAAIDSETVYAIAEVEVRSSEWDGRREDGITPLEYDFGSVRVSTLDFYFPSFMLNDEGSYVVTNVISVMNTTVDTALAMQLLPLHDACAYISVEPAHVVTVRPQQRAYFTATWTIGECACMKKLHLQLLVNGPRPVSAPIIINVHSSTPQPNAIDTPYHYWLNAACITNRHFSPSDEFPLLLSLLPVFRPSVQRHKNGSRGAVTHDLEDGTPFIAEAVTIVGALNGNSMVYPVSADSSTQGVQPVSAHSQGPQSGVTMLPFDAPAVDVSQKTCRCILRLGTIRGFPMVSEFAASASSAFQVSITLLDQQGWKVVTSETQPQYQSASGSLQWDDELELWKWPGAKCQQFLRLNLAEVRPYDGDTVPIGAALVSLSTLDRIHPCTGFNVAFYVYETYSLYDSLHTSSLLMTGASITFLELPMV
ncbi:hypothetical protein, conserved [Trypanosoma brucei gambiense DAL972]|uniref:Uncharacterized protein n=1 Tax=Trypanosoma brucei gambiense (strain MHOM/CI/86/DAL972) TaxID=679716 RepID=C9ZQ83_TRYB9|nr:hypothetical protein, conserved [Trypanosoma brucei gambiense DAL972]CBH11563.1 hypothetical protein, conserved [Trypanosoma brucei gambiense DAL972]|eukprot:XP_011773848.1 hypothetical protein, conserved [Trypanosoma brucei gambiense DAL972]